MAIPNDGEITGGEKHSRTSNGNGISMEQNSAKLLLLFFFKRFGDQKSSLRVLGDNDGNLDEFPLA